MFNKLLVMLAAFSLTFIGCDDDDKKEPAQDCVVRDAEVAGEEPCEGNDCDPAEPVAGEEVPCEGDECPDCEGEDCDVPVPAGEEVPCEGDDCEPEPVPAGTETTETAGEEVPSAGEETPEAGAEPAPEPDPAGEEAPVEGGSDEAGTEVIPG